MGAGYLYAVGQWVMDVYRCWLLYTFLFGFIMGLRIIFETVDNSARHQIRLELEGIIISQ